jgi:hypothetical protein
MMCVGQVCDTICRSFTATSSQRTCCSSHTLASASNCVISGTRAATVKASAAAVMLTEPVGIDRQNLFGARSVAEE